MRDAITTKRVERMVSLRQMLGKRVVSKSGVTLGRVKDVLVLDEQVQGIATKELFIDRQFISQNGEAVMLSIDPVTLLVGKVVYDAAGRKIGRVKSIVRQGANDYSELIVKKGLFSKPVHISKPDVQTAKTNILLSRSL